MTVRAKPFLSKPMTGKLDERLAIWMSPKPLSSTLGARYGYTLTTPRIVGLTSAAFPKRTSRTSSWTT